MTAVAKQCSIFTPLESSSVNVLNICLVLLCLPSATLTGQGWSYLYVRSIVIFLILFMSP